MDDTAARNAMIKVVRDWLDGALSTNEFITRYWSVRNRLLDSNWSAFEGGFGAIMGEIDSAAHAFSAEDDRADWEIDEKQFRAEGAAVMTRLRDEGFVG